MAYQTILLAEAADVATITLDRPEAGNAINVKMVEDLTKAAHQIEDESKADAVVINAAGGDFSVGIDLLDFPADQKPDVHGFSRWEKVVRAYEKLPKFTVAAIHGQCAGGGLQLALACDVRVASTDSVFHLYEAKFGFLPGMATYRLAKFIGLGRARRMALTGRKVGAKEALDMGLVDILFEPGQENEAVAGALAEFDHNNPVSLELIRRLLNESYDHSYEDFIGGFLAAQQRAISTDAFVERLQKAHKTKTPQGDK